MQSGSAACLGALEEVDVVLYARARRKNIESLTLKKLMLWAWPVGIWSCFCPDMFLPHQEWRLAQEQQLTAHYCIQPHCQHGGWLILYHTGEFSVELSWYPILNYLHRHWKREKAGTWFLAPTKSTQLGLSKLRATRKKTRNVYSFCCGKTGCKQAMS